ncbi:MAG: substrate-binding domain-containing protein, partial [Phycisphaerae bacterium]|nr:substrate-binding domain-containing protein [Phycisphaerae bacterium]
PTASTQPVSAKPTTYSLRVTGPWVAKEMLEALVTEFGSASAGGAASPGAVRLEFMRNDTAKGAAGALTAGRDFVLTVGKLNDRDIPVSKDRWEALAVEEHVVAARAVAIVVHERNPVDSLTMDQLIMLFSGRAKDWSAFGGTGRAVRCYGLAGGLPQTVLFHEKVLPAARCGPITRRKDSSEVLAALASDPQAIAFVDAVAALSAGDSVKIVAIGSSPAAGGKAGGTAVASPAAGGAKTGGATGGGKPDGDATTDGGPVSPNAQTIKDGTYPLATMVVLYVAPSATSPAGQEFVEFLQSGKGDAVIRKYSFMPTLRAESIDGLAAFERLYGPEIKRVKATPDTADDLALAGRMTQSARRSKLDAGLVAAMCEAAYDLSATVPGGQVLAFEALAVLAERAPSKRFTAAAKRAAMYERAYKNNPSQTDGDHLVEALMTAADIGITSRHFAEAADMWSQALLIAEEFNSPHTTTLLKRQGAFDARAKSVKRLATLESQLREDPRDPILRRNLLDLHLLELDNPTAAAKFLDTATTDEESLKTNIPLATTAIEKLSEDATLKLAEWYGDLIDQAGPGGKELLAARALTCYRRFFDLHPNRNDAKATRAKLGFEKLGGNTAESIEPPPATDIILTVTDDTTDLKLAEFIINNSHLTGLYYSGDHGSRVFAPRLLERLTNLRKLHIHEANDVREISPLATLTTLRELVISGLDVDDISALVNMEKLLILELENAKNLSDIRPISRLTELRTVILSGGTKISDLTPLTKLPSLNKLNLDDCTSIRDFSPLEKMSKTLTFLSLANCRNVPLRTLGTMTNLKELHLRGCDKFTEDDLEWLANRLKNCKISHELLNQK